MNIRRPSLIAFEGIDGVGKSTQALMLKSALEAREIPVILTAEPSDGPIGSKIRNLRTRPSPFEEEKLFREDRKDHVLKVVLPALNRGVNVIIDRYVYSSAAYQGAGGLNPEHIIAANFEFAPRPDLVLLLELDVSEAVERINARRRSADIFENKTYLEQVAKIYRAIRDPAIRRISGSGPAENVHAAILNIFLAE
jgi:dTMP kinase